MLVFSRMAQDAQARAAALLATLAGALLVVLRPSADAASIAHAVHGTFVAPRGSAGHSAVLDAEECAAPSQCCAQPPRSHTLSTPFPTLHSLLWPKWCLLLALGLAVVGVLAAPALGKRLLRRGAFASLLGFLVGLYCCAQALPPEPVLYAIHVPPFVCAAVLLACAWPARMSPVAAQAAAEAVSTTYVVLVGCVPLALTVQGSVFENAPRVRGVDYVRASTAMLAATHAAAHLIIAAVLSLAYSARTSAEAAAAQRGPRMGRAPVPDGAAGGDLLAARGLTRPDWLPYVINASVLACLAAALYLNATEFSASATAGAACCAVLLLLHWPDALARLYRSQPRGAARAAGALPWRVRAAPAVAALVALSVWGATRGLALAWNGHGNGTYRQAAIAAGFAPHSVWAWLAGAAGHTAMWDSPTFSAAAALPVLIANTALAAAACAVNLMALAHLLLPGAAASTFALLAAAPPALLALLLGDLRDVQALGAAGLLAVAVAATATHQVSHARTATAAL